MQFVVVRYSQPRDVFVDGQQLSQTDTMIRLQAGTHDFDLGLPNDYSPATVRRSVIGTTRAEPMEIAFAPLVTVAADAVETEPPTVFAKSAKKVGAKKAGVKRVGVKKVGVKKVGVKKVGVKKVGVKKVGVKKVGVKKAAGKKRDVKAAVTKKGLGKTTRKKKAGKKKPSRNP